MSLGAIGFMRMTYSICMIMDINDWRHLGFHANDIQHLHDYEYKCLEAFRYGGCVAKRNVFLRTDPCFTSACCSRIARGSGISATLPGDHWLSEARQKSTRKHVHAHLVLPCIALVTPWVCDEGPAVEV